MKESSGKGFVCKKSNIRIWIHHRDLANLQQVIWEGHGSKLLVEHSNNPKVRKFLEGVPHIMGLIKDVHADVLNNDIDALKAHTADPVPPIVLSGKDNNGLTPLHKAAGLGHYEIAEYILSKYPNSIHLKDNMDRTPLHYSPLAKDDNKMFDLLTSHGADESCLDSKERPASYYKTKCNEIDPNLLRFIPECPRTAKESFLDSWDWNLLTNIKFADENKKKKSDPTKYRETKIQRLVKVENEPNTEEDLNKSNHEVKEDKVEVDNEEEEQTENSTAEYNNSESYYEENLESNEKPESESHTTEINKEMDIEKNHKPHTEEHDNVNIVEESNKNDDNQKDSSILDRKEHERENEKSGTQKQTTNDGDDSMSKFLGDRGNDNNNRIEHDNNTNYRETHNKISKSDSIKELKNMSLVPVVDNTVSAMSERFISSEIASENRENQNQESQNENKGRWKDKVHGNSIDETHVEGSEGVIEGIVNGENEVESVNEEGQGLNSVGDKDDDDDEEVTDLIRSDNMEQLAALVLNGDGDRLINRKSENSEIQAFLDNVPVYMSKIHRIHVAAKNGSLKDLQAALDRRKFAIAKDRISPNGATPLHVAVIFGNTSIVRYLAGRFPETVNTIDDNGRSPLHFAAALDDNSHYYNLLVHLGADQNLSDNFGHTPEYYKTNRNELSHRSLLSEFGGDELADEILKDKDKLSNNNHIDMPFFWTEEGRYLASSLGDPLIKGLTEVANKRPEDPIAYLASYLYNFAKNNDTQQHSKSNFEEEPISATNKEDNSKLHNSTSHKDIDIVTLDPNKEQQGNSTAFNPTTRDEHGQSMLHFAAARSHSRNALFQLLEETDINVGYRDELYRTARDISIQADMPENTLEIDKYVLHIASRGDTDKLVELLLEGYDHIIDIVDEDNVPIIEAVSKMNQSATVAFLQSILAFEEKRERVHYAIRQGNLNEVQDLLADENDTGSGKLLAVCKNNYGRCSLHIAVLCQQEEIVDYLVVQFPETLNIGDNLERTALHYAMGVEKIETISKVLIKAGAKRVIKDLKGRQPTYYFMNKSDILRLQEEEETF